MQYNIETFLLIVYSLLRNFIYQYIIYINNNNNNNNKLLYL